MTTEPPTQPIDAIEVKSLHGNHAELITLRLTSAQDIAASVLASYAREVAHKTGLPWTSDHEDAARLLVQALVDAAEERLADAMIELARSMIEDKT